MWDLSSLTRDWTHVPCIAGRILNHWTTREVSSLVIFNFHFSRPSEPTDDFCFRVSPLTQFPGKQSRRRWERKGRVMHISCREEWSWLPAVFLIAVMNCLGHLPSSQSPQGSLALCLGWRLRGFHGQGRAVWWMIEPWMSLSCLSSTKLIHVF